MVLVRPRLNDHFDLPFTQEQVDFAIPFLDEDIPLYADPFLLWKSPSMQDNALHTALITAFNNIGRLAQKGSEGDAITTLIRASECSEVGLGVSKTQKGTRIGEKTANNIIALFKDIPHVSVDGFEHFETIQLLVGQIASDRISDIACNILKSFLIDYTIEQSQKHAIPLNRTTIKDVFSYKTNKFTDEDVDLPINPVTGIPILLTPKHWLRKISWINYDDYFDKNFGSDTNVPKSSNAVLTYNRNNYDMVQTYIKAKERTQEDCKNDPLFTPIPVTSAKRKLSSILKLPSGKENNADKKYEDSVCQLMASLLYPHLDFAAEQSRTESGALIRDLVFYNNRSLEFLTDIHRDFGSKQIVMELKNVAKVEREHINQLNRYLSDHFGKFGVIICRNPIPKSILQHTIDLWSGQRKCIIVLTDAELSMMVDLFESRQRLPIDVLKAKYIEFIRKCPS